MHKQFPMHRFGRLQQTNPPKHMARILQLFRKSNGIPFWTFFDPNDTRGSQGIHPIPSNFHLDPVLLGKCVGGFPCPWRPTVPLRSPESAGPNEHLDPRTKYENMKSPWPHASWITHLPLITCTQTFDLRCVQVSMAPLSAMRWPNIVDLPLPEGPMKTKFTWGSSLAILRMCQDVYPHWWGLWRLIENLFVSVSRGFVTLDWSWAQNVK